MAGEEGGCSHFALLLLAAALFLNGCSAAYHRRQADREVYSIVQSAEKQVFGHQREFSVDTPYSGRPPHEIPAGEIIEDRQRADALLLSLDQAIALAVQNSRQYQTEKERLYLTALTLTGERYEFGPKLFASGTASLDRFSDGEQRASAHSRISVSQALKTGGRIGAAIANDLLRYYTGDPRRSAISAVSVNLLQPLLRGFGSNSPAVESLTQAERNVIYSVREYSFFQDEFALRIANDYFSLLAQKDLVRNRYANYLSRVQSSRRLEARARDRERLSDVDQARQAELTARNNYINAVTAYQNSLDQFKIRLGFPLGVRLRLDDALLNELETLGTVPVLLNEEEAFRFSVHNQLRVLNAIDRFEDSKRKVQVAANRLRADLNIFGDAALTSEGPTDYTRFDANKVRAGAGIELNLPLDRLRERNNYRASLISFESELRSLSLTLDNLKDSIQRGLRVLEQRRQSYEIQKNALEVANRRVASTRLLLEAGRAEVRDLIEAQDAQIAAQTAVTSALVGYQEVRLQLMLDLGILDTEPPKFWLLDHVREALRRAPTEESAEAPLQKDVVPPEIVFEEEP